MLEGYFLFQAFRLPGFQAFKLPGFQASWHPGFCAFKHFFIFCHLACLGLAANPFFSEFFHHQLLHVASAMAGHQVPMTHGCKQWLLFQTAVHGKGTTRMKPAAGGGINGAGNVSGQNDTPRLAFDVRSRNGR
jgi:hypothetical protein